MNCLMLGIFYVEGEVVKVIFVSQQGGRTVSDEPNNDSGRGCGYESGVEKTAEIIMSYQEEDK